MQYKDSSVSLMKQRNFSVKIRNASIYFTAKTSARRSRDLPQYFKSQDGTGTGKEQNWQQFQHFQIKIIILQWNFVKLFDRIESRLNFCSFVECARHILSPEIPELQICIWFNKSLSLKVCWLPRYGRIKNKTVFFKMLSVVSFSLSALTALEWTC